MTPADRDFALLCWYLAAFVCGLIVGALSVQ